LNTAQVYAALRQRFCAPEWAIFFEVANGTGHHGRRYADAVAMNLYPSRGLEINGFEVKVSRSDWHRERMNPAKAEDIYKYCDRWWLVVGDASIVQPGELPSTWGLIVPKGKGLAIATQAPKLTPEPLDRKFFAALCRRASEPGQAEVDALVRTRVDEALERSKPYDRTERARAQQELTDLRQTVSAFEGAAGFSIKQGFGWRDRDPAKIGEAVKFILEGGVKALDEPLAIMEQHALRLAERIKQVRATPELAAAQPEPTGSPA
jgi:hypothetical protein